MATEFKLPVLAENVDKVTVTKVLVNVGDVISVDQPVVEIETDKASTEVPSTVSGTVTDVRAKEGEAMRVGDIVLVVSENGAQTARGAKEVSKSESAPAAKPAPVEAVPLREETEEAAVEPVRAAEPSPVVSAPAPAAPRTGAMPPSASPSVRRLAREIGIDIAEVPGTGPYGRVTMEDVKAYSRRARTDVRSGRGPAPLTIRTAVAPPLPPRTVETSALGAVEREAMNSVRRRTAENMTGAWTTIPHVTQFDKADISEFDRLRGQFGKRVEAAGGKLTVTAVLVKVITTALKRFPQFNAVVDMPAQEIVYKRFYNIGVAVDTDRGLLVPVIHNADRKNIIEIAVELQGLAARAREKKNRLDEMQGATFTISNLGGIGGTSFTPIVNPPEVAILGVSRSRVEPVYLDGSFQPRNMLPLSLSYDHRVIDGADAARFLRWVCEAVEQPFLLSLEG